MAGLAEKSTRRTSYLPVIVYSPLSGLEQHFPCGKWLATDEDDGQISRDLQEAAHLRVNKGKKIPWDVIVHTTDKRNAGTDANVSLTIYGDKGKSDQMSLETEGNPFERGQTDQFLVGTEKIGTPFKIRIQHDGTGVGAGWHLNSVELINRVNGNKYEFPCEEWLAEDEGDGECIREIAAQGKHIKKPPPVVEYEVEVHTGKKFGAGTDADVFCCIYGEKGDTGDRPLKESKNNRNKFEKGKIDTFTVRAVSLKKLSKLRIGHNGQGAGAGWYLEKVVVRESGSSKSETTFPCSRWLAEDEDDGEIVRDLYPAGSRKDSRHNLLKSTTYKLSVKTGDLRSAGTDADVYVQLFGKHGETEKMFLTNSESSKDPFERGRTDLFTVEAEAVGKLKRLRIGHNGKGLGSGWFLSEVEVGIPCRGESYRFPCNEWLATDEGQKRTEIDLEPEEVAEAEKTIPYEVTIETGDVRGGGTDANVFVQIYGAAGKTKNFNLRNKTDNFERGETDVFKVEGTDVGKIQKIRIGTDGKGMASGWFLNTVEIRKPSTKHSRKRKHEKGRKARSKDGDRRMSHDTRRKASLGRANSRQSLRRASSFPRHSDSSDSGNSKKYSKRRKSLATRRMSEDSEEDSEDVFSSPERGNSRRKTERAKNAVHDKAQDRRRSQSLGGRKELATDKRSKFRAQKIDRNRRASSFNVSGKNKKRNYDYEETDLSEDGDKRYSKHRMSDRRNSKKHEDDYSSLDDDSEESALKYGRKQTDGRRGSSQRGKGGWDDYESEYSSDDKYRASRTPSESEQSESRSEYDDSDPNRPSTSMRKGKSQRRKSRAYDDEDSEDERRDEKRKLAQKKKRKEASESESDFEDVDENDKKEDKKERLRKLQRKSSMLIAANTKKRAKAQKRREDDEYFSESESEEEEEDTASDSDSSELTAREKFERSRKAKANGKNVARKGSKQKNMKNKADSDESVEEEDSEDEKFETYLFVCRRWFAKSEDDGKLIRELLPTDENGRVLKDNDLDYVPYEFHVFTGDVSGAGTDANVFINLYGEDGDTGARQLDKSSTNKNKFERNQEDVFIVEAVELGKLRKLKVWHDNSGVGAAWFLDRIEVVDPANDKRWIFPCEKWMSTKKDDGQISRELVPVTEAQMRRLSRSRKSSVREELGLEMSNQVTPYYVSVKTGNVRGAGTDANVYIVLYGEDDDSGTVYLKTSRTNKNKFERGKTDEFVVEAVDLGEIRKILIGHDNKGGFADWHLDSVTVDCPSLGRRWHFPADRWLAKNRDDGQLEVELLPAPTETQEYDACIPHEFTIYTTDKRGAGTDSNVFVALFGEKGRFTREVPLCPEKSERKTHFNRGSVDKFIIELEDVGEVVTKLRIGHDGTSWGAGWHLDKVELKKMLPKDEGFLNYTFPCGRWLAKDEEDGSIVRDLLPSEARKELIKSDGTTKQKNLKRQSSIKMKKYQIKVYTGDVILAGTDSNVFINITGKLGDTGKRKLGKSETHKNKFERGKVDVFNFDFGDLGEVFKVEVEHDDSFLKSDWFLEKIEVIDMEEDETTTFYCGKWLGKGKDDRELKRTLFVKGYDEKSLSGELSSRDERRSLKKNRPKKYSFESESEDEPSRSFSRNSHQTSTRNSRKKPASKFSDSEDETARTFTRSKSQKGRDSSEEDERMRSVIPYTVKVTTGEDKDCGTRSRAWIRIWGGNKETGKLYLDILGRNHEFHPGSQEVFSLDAKDVGKVTEIEVGLEWKENGDAWLIREIEVSQPTKGRRIIFKADEWLGKEKGDGRIKRRYLVNKSDATALSFRPLLPMELTLFTADQNQVGIDCKVWVKLFGKEGASKVFEIGRQEVRFQKGRSDPIKVELEDVGEPLKIRIGLNKSAEHPKKGQNIEIFLEKIELVNLFTDKEHHFKATGLLSLNGKSRDGKPTRDFPAVSARGKLKLDPTSYKISVVTSDMRGAGTDANVGCMLFGEFGDSSALELKESVRYRNKFERSHTDVFHFNNVLSLGRLSGLRIWHDNSGLGASWHLDRVEVEDVDSGEKYMFPCGRWLSTSEDDRQLCRELVCERGAGNENLDESGRTVYEVTVVTGDKRDAGTENHAWLTLSSNSGNSKKFWMENLARRGILQRGQTDQFDFKTQPLGKLRSLTLGHYPRDKGTEGRKSNKERENSWFCQEVRVKDTTDGTTYMFPCKQWLATSSKAREAVELECSSIQDDSLASTRRVTQYEVRVITGNERRAGTDANVFLTIHGENGDSGKRALKQKFRNLFERGQTDTFTIECFDLGKLSKLDVEHDNSGLGPGWMLEKIEVRNSSDKSLTVFPCGNKWLDAGKGAGATHLEVYPKYA